MYRSVASQQPQRTRSPPPIGPPAPPHPGPYNPGADPASGVEPCVPSHPVTRSLLKSSHCCAARGARSVGLDLDWDGATLRLRLGFHVNHALELALLRKRDDLGQREFWLVHAVAP